MQDSISSLLKPWQVSPVESLLSTLSSRQSAVDMSDTGVGKTFVACAVAKSLCVNTLVIAPKISLTAWRDAASVFGLAINVVGYEKLRTGRTEFGSWDRQDRVEAGSNTYYVCEFCQQRIDLESIEPCYCHGLGIHCINTKRKSPVRGNFNFVSGIGLTVFDEIHRCCGSDSLNADMVLAAKRSVSKILGLSATMALGPLKMRALGYMLDLHGDKFDRPEVPNFYRWAARHGCRKLPGTPGLQWAVGEDKQTEIMAAIRSEIIPSRGVRVTKDSIPGFPEVDISAELYDLESGGSLIDRLYEEMADALEELENLKTFDKSSEHPLTKLLRARQEIELLKVPVAVELATDAVEKGFSIGIFVNYSQTLNELRRRLDCNCFIDGSQLGVKYRQRSIDGFQSDNERIILVNSAAGGVCVSLQDVRGFFPRGGLVFPGLSANVMKQVFGRFPRTGSKSKSFYKVLLAAGTIETKYFRKLQRALNNLDAFNDGDLVPDGFRINKAISGLDGSP